MPKSTKPLQSGTRVLFPPTWTQRITPPTHILWCVYHEIHKIPPGFILFKSLPFLPSTIVNKLIIRASYITVASPGTTPPLEPRCQDPHVPMPPPSGKQLGRKAQPTFPMSNIPQQPEAHCSNQTPISKDSKLRSMSPSREASPRWLSWCRRPLPWRKDQYQRMRSSQQAPTAARMRHTLRYHTIASLMLSINRSFDRK